MGLMILPHAREKAVSMCPASLCDTLKPGREWTAHCDACALLRCPSSVKIRHTAKPEMLAEEIWFGGGVSGLS